MVKTGQKTQTNTIKLVEKELKLVTKNHCRNTWLAIGMVFQNVGLTYHWHSCRNDH